MPGIHRFLMGFLLAASAAGAGVPAGTETNAFWFPVGERLRYRLYWGFIPVGTAELESAWTEFEGRPHLALRAWARTTAILSAIFPVDDRVESIVDPETFLPVQYEQILNEGRHHRHDLFTFDHAGRKAYWRSLLKERSRIVDIGPDTRDVLTLLYAMRAEGLSVGEQRMFRVVVDEKLYDLFVEGLEYEILEAAGAGDVRCLKVEPQAQFGGIFVRKGRVQAWFTDNARRICVRMTGRVPVASVKAVLTEVGGPGASAWAE
ncbi:MAG: DUF3108 domain-containing protein [Lentisphaerae bacterium]|nr:DUF3108 domain-containing protein [Lentisphaerota bacterium]